jgi:methylthioribose-1-phosphate isomerase
VTRRRRRRHDAGGAEALNIAFDVTPAELITAIVTEVGVLEPPYEEAIARALARNDEGGG